MINTLKRLGRAALLLSGLYATGCSELVGDWKDDFRRTQYYTTSEDQPTVERLTKINTDYDSPLGGKSKVHVGFVDNDRDGKVDFVEIDSLFFAWTDYVTLVDEIPDDQKFESPVLGLVKHSSHPYKRSDGIEGTLVHREYLFQHSHPSAVKFQEDYDQARKDYKAWKDESLTARIDDWRFNRRAIKINHQPENVWQAALLY